MPASPSFTALIETVGHTILVTMAGELDDHSTLALANVFELIHPSPGDTVIVDVGEVDFMSRSAMQLLVVAAVSFHQDSGLIVARASPAVREQLDLMHVEILSLDPVDD